MKENGTSEYALLINFTKALQCYLPLATPQKLADPDFPIPISIVLGDDDWMREVDLGASELVVMNNQKRHGRESNHYILPTAGHNLHIDNMNGLVNIIINEILYISEEDAAQRLPVIET